jgi:hypothetical protein
MRSWLTRVALAATLALPLLTHAAAAQPGTGQDRPTRPHLAVEGVLRHQGHLALDSVQVSRLSELARRLQASPTRLRIAGSDRVPGKATPRVERTRITSREALKKAIPRAHPRPANRSGETDRVRQCRSYISVKCGLRRQGGTQSAALATVRP